MTVGSSIGTGIGSNGTEFGPNLGNGVIERLGTITELVATSNGGRIKLNSSSDVSLC